MQIFIKYKRLIFFYLMLIVNLAILFLIYLLRPILLIRFGKIKPRIGRAGMDIDIYLSEKKLRLNQPKTKSLDFFIWDSLIPNSKLKEMIEKKITVLPSIFISTFDLIRKVKYFNYHIIDTSNGERDTLNVTDLISNQLTLSDKDYSTAENIFYKYFSKDAKVILFCIRDSEYLKKKFPDRDWTFEDRRDYSLDKFYLAAENLTKRGYYVLRMGRETKLTFKSLNNKIIDYANSDWKSDLMDVYLGMKCSFCLTTATGMDVFAWMFRKPIVELKNPLSISRLSKKTLLLTKHHYYKSDDKELTLSKIMKIGEEQIINPDKDFMSKKGIYILDNSPEEISEVALEMLDKLENKWKYQKNDHKLQKQFADVYNTEVKNYKTYRFKNVNMRGAYSTNFLRKNIEWLN